MKRESELVGLCIEAACESRESVEKWRMQRRSLDRLPSPVADALLRRLIARRLLYPSLLDAEEVDVRDNGSVDAEWMAYLGAFRHLRYLNLADCHRITTSALWPITGMNTLQELDLSRCFKVNDAGISHLLSIPNLVKLRISETGVTAKGVKLLASLENLSLLDLGGLPVDDVSLISLQVLKRLQHIDLWGSKISNKGAAVLNKFLKLSYLNLAWTSVTKLPTLSSLECLDMSNCTIDSILEDDKSPLAKLIFSGATFLNESGVFSYANTNLVSFLDVAHTDLHKFFFLSKMKLIEHLSLSSCMMGDDSVEMVACVGANLKSLNLSGTRVSSAGLGILAGHVPNLEILSLSQTPLDDTGISFISMMPSLKDVDLSNTYIKGWNIYWTVNVGFGSGKALGKNGYWDKTSLDPFEDEGHRVQPKTVCPSTIQLFHEASQWCNWNSFSLFPRFLVVDGKCREMYACEGDEARMLFWPFLRPERVYLKGRGAPLCYRF
ncbi:hypothetical protein V8G54_002803 [Vigna mungo]|uniref:Uncharacterized protein n=1 Tax=Vigna mungo TaxID=3915 RepID=A0AAQ3SDD8_VIGMU